MLRCYGTIAEQLAWCERPVAPAAITGIFCPFPYRRSYTSSNELRLPDPRYRRHGLLRTLSSHSAYRSSPCFAPQPWAIGARSYSNWYTPNETPQYQYVPSATLVEEESRPRDQDFLDPDIALSPPQRPSPEDIERERLALFEDENAEYEALLDTRYTKSCHVDPHLRYRTWGEDAALSEEEQRRLAMFEEEDVVAPYASARQQTGYQAYPGAIRVSTFGKGSAAHWVKPAPDIQDLPKDWTAAYDVVSGLVTEHEQLQGKTQLTSRLQYYDELRSWEKHYRDNTRTPASHLEYWKTMSHQEIHDRWHPIMLHVTLQDSDQALLLLQGLVRTYQPPLILVLAILELITRLQWVRRRSFLKTTGQSSDFWDLLLEIIRVYDHIPSFRQRTIQLALQRLPLSDLPSALSSLENSGYQLNAAVRSAMARQLAIHKNMNDALRQLQIGLEVGNNDKKHPHFQTTVAKLVREAKTMSNDQRGVADLVNELFEMSIELTLPAYNNLILNAAEDGDHETAWETFKLMKQHGIEPNDYTWAIMLKMERMRRNKAAYRRLYFELNPEAKDTLEPWLLTELLQCWNEFSFRDNFNHVMRFYERHCDLQPLRDLGIIHPEYESRFKDWYIAPRPLPSPEALTSVLLKFLQCQYRGKPVVRLWLSFQKLLRRGDPLIVEMAAQDYVWNAFFKALSHRPSFLGTAVLWKGHVNPIHWTTMLRCMTRAPQAGAIHPKTGAPLQRLQPTERTFNILLNAHARAGNAAEADRILGNMKKRGIQPSIVSWNALLSGFARLQHMGLVSLVLHQMKTANIAADNRTAEALAHLDDREDLLGVMRTLDHGPSRQQLRIAMRAQRERLQEMSNSSTSQRSGVTFVFKQTKLRNEVRKWAEAGKGPRIERYIPFNPPRPLTEKDNAIMEGIEEKARLRKLQQDTAREEYFQSDEDDTANIYYGEVAGRNTAQPACADGQEVIEHTNMIENTDVEAVEEFEHVPENA